MDGLLGETGLCPLVGAARKPGEFSTSPLDEGKTLAGEAAPGGSPYEGGVGEGEFPRRDGEVGRGRAAANGSSSTRSGVYIEVVELSRAW